jgi:membrane associated rhomboid family serine protease
MVRASQQISVVQQWFELDSNKVVYSGQIWRLLTHAFCHDRHSIFHILFNMLLLFWFGRTLELMYGSREFLLFYFTSAVAGGIAYVGMDLYTGSNVPAIGASGAVMAVMMLYTVHFPRETILVFYVIPVEMRFLMALYAMWDLHPILLILAGDPVWTGVAHAAHLGGLVFGFLYGHYTWRLERLGDRFSGLSVGTKSRPRLRILHPEPPETRSYPDARRLDEVLEKISSRGQDSLTEEERTILRAASEKLRTRARDS